MRISITPSGQLAGSLRPPTPARGPRTQPSFRELTTPRQNLSFVISPLNRTIGASNNAITRCWALKASDPRSASVDPSTNSETISDHDNVVIKSCPQPEKGNSFVPRWMPYNRPSWPEVNRTLIRSGLALLSPHHGALPSEPVLTDP